MKMLHSCAILVLLVGCSSNPESNIIPDTNRNPAKFVVDVKSIPNPSNSTGLNHSVDANKMVPPAQPPATKPQVEKHAAPPVPKVEKSPKVITGGNSGAGSSGTPGVVAQPIAKSVLKYHTCLRDCAGCKKWHPWAERQKRKKLLLLDFEIVSHATPDAAYEAVPGITGVPCFELIDTFGQHHFRTLTDAGMHGDWDVCPGCVNNWLKWNGKPPVNVQFDRPADVRVAAAVQAMNLKPLVGAGLKLCKSWLGNGSIRFMIRRGTGAKTVFPMVNGGTLDTSFGAIFGSSGCIVEYTATGTNLPKDHYSVELGEDSIGGPYFKPLDKVYFKDVQGLLPKSSAVSAQPVGFAFLPILSGIGMLLKVFSWHADLHVEPTIEIDVAMPRDSIEVKVMRGAWASLDWIKRSEATVTSFTIGPESAVVNTVGSWVIPRRKVIKF